MKTWTRLKVMQTFEISMNISTERYKILMDHQQTLWVYDMNFIITEDQETYVRYY